MDTGLHYTGMKRDEAIKLFAEKAWDDSDFTRKEVRELFSDEKSIMDKLRCHCLSCYCVSFTGKPKAPVEKLA